MSTSNAPSGLVERVCTAIKILPFKTQEGILSRIKAEKGISVRLRVEIADLLDAEIARKGGVEFLQARYNQLAGTYSRLGGEVTQAKAAADAESTAETEDMDQYASKELDAEEMNVITDLTRFERNLFANFEQKSDRASANDEIAKIMNDMKQPKKGDSPRADANEPQFGTAA